MTKTRWRKIIGNLAQRPARTLLTLFGLSLGLAFLGSVVTAFAILRDDLDANFRLTNPPNITLSAGDVPAALSGRIAAIPGVTGVDERPELGALIQTRPDRWMPLIIAVVRDFRHLSIARFAVENGQWPPASGSILIERDGRWFFEAPPISLAIRLPNGADIRSAFSGYVFDPGQHPSRMEQVLYGYITPETLANWSFPLKSTRLLITTSPAAAVAAGARIEALFQEAGVKLERLEVHPTPQHGHKFQFDTIMTLLAGLAAVALIMCAILIINLIDSLMAMEQRTIGVLRALGARSGQIVQDYTLAMGALGALAGTLSLYPSLWTGKTIARFVTTGLNFNVLSPAGPVWLIPLLLCIGIVIPISVALSAIYRAAFKPVRRALARGDAGQAFPFADGFGALLTFLPLIPRLGVRAVARKPRKVLLSALILSLGLAFFITALTIRASMLSTVDSVRRTRSFDVAVGLRAAEPVDKLTAWMAEIPEVRHREYWSTAEATLLQAGPRFNNPKPIIGIPSDTESIHPDVIAGHWIEAAFPAGIAVNQRLLRDEPDLHLGGAYTMVVDGHRVDVNVVGVIEEFSAGQIYCSKLFLDGLRNQEGRANAIVLTLDDGSFAAQRHAASKIQGSAIGPDRQISGMLLTRTLEMVIFGHLDILTGLLMLIAVIALMVGAMGLASTISISVVERFREIAILKAIGGRGSSIAALFATEAVVIALIGWAISVALTPLLSHPMVSGLGSAVIGYKFEYRTSPIGVALALGVAILVALLAAILPIRAAMRLTIRNGLRAE
jgi:putative ABC transport system permease protein